MGIEASQHSSQHTLHHCPPPSMTRAKKSSSKTQKLHTKLFIKPQSIKPVEAQGTSQARAAPECRQEAVQEGCRCTCRVYEEKGRREREVRPPGGRGQRGCLARSHPEADVPEGQPQAPAHPPPSPANGPTTQPRLPARKRPAARVQGSARGEEDQVHQPGRWYGEAAGQVQGIRSAEAAHEGARPLPRRRQDSPRDAPRPWP